MQYAIIAVLILASAAILTWWSNKKKTDWSNSLVRLCVPLSDPVSFEPAQFTKSFREQWGGDMVCDERPDWADPKERTRRYTVTDGRERGILAVSDQPLLPRWTEMILLGASVSDRERCDLQGHKSTLTIEVVPDERDPMGSARFAVRLLFTSLERFPAAGALSITGQNYQPMQRVRQLMDVGTLDQHVLFLVCTVVHNVPDTNPLWMHTHGMQCFGLPDLEIKYTDASREDYYHDLLGNTALYLMDCGPVMKPGHTAELAGDGVIYQIKLPSGESRKHFGKYGGLEIAPR